MTETQALLTAARRYCQTQYSYWADRYSRERSGATLPYGYTDTDYKLFPRYQVLSAILDELETGVGQDQLPIDSYRQVLSKIGQSAHNLFTTGMENPVALLAMQAERASFSHYIETIPVDTLRTIEPLPHKRRLTSAENNDIRGALRTIWNVQEGYWNPLNNRSPKPTVFLAKANIDPHDYARIRARIIQKADSVLIRLTEDGAVYELDPELFHPDCYETVYCDRRFDWIVYGSHERTVTFGGTWLLPFIEQVYADRKHHLNAWENPFNEAGRPV